MKVYVPPIKSQGIKTKLVPWINQSLPEDFDGLWIEPFMGTSVVGFNVPVKKALMCDINPHLVNFYIAIKEGKITPKIVYDFLQEESQNLLKNKDEHYYKIRKRFNVKNDPLDFLFLNRSGFNGMIRFNNNGKLNTPFCKKPNRFAKAYITKIVNQVEYISYLLSKKDFVFKCQSYEETIREGTEKDLIYCDPPYIGRHVDYYNGWNDQQEQTLFDVLSKTKSRFILSTWHHNDFRKNEYIDLLWNKFHIYTKEHFYHVGGKEKNRNTIIEAIITNYNVIHADNNTNTYSSYPCQLSIIP